MADATQADFPFMIGNSLPRSQFKSRVYQPILDQFAVRNMNCADIGSMSVYDANKMKSQGRSLQSGDVLIYIANDYHRPPSLRRKIRFTFTTFSSRGNSIHR